MNDLYKTILKNYFFKNVKKRDKFTHCLEEIFCCSNPSDSSFNHNNTIKE